MLAPIFHILPLTTIRRRRVLPVNGKVLVRAGQKVTSREVIAETLLTPEHITVDIARGLGVAPKRVAEFLERAIGDEVAQDGILAKRSGLTSRVVRAPQAGRVVAVSGGQILLEITNQPYKLRSGMPGDVASVEPERGAVIETTGVWVQGVWGNGRLNYGSLTNIADNPDHVLTPKDLDVTQRGSVLLAGHCFQAACLDEAAEIGLKGLILGSMAPNLVLKALNMPYPIIILDGFGPQAMNSAAYTLLSTNVSRETTVNAQPLDHFLGQRPEIIISLESTQGGRVPRDIDKFAEQQKVRILRAPHTGKIATITAIVPGLTRFPSGLRLPAADVELDGGKKTLVPLANIEVLG